MSRLFQPSEVRDRKSANQYGISSRTFEASFPSSSAQIPGRAASRISKLRPSSAAMGPQNTRTDMDITSRPSTTQRIVNSNTRVTVTSNTGEKKVLKKLDSSVNIRASHAIKHSAVVPIPPPSILRKEVSLQVKNMYSKAQIGSKVTAIGFKKTKVSALEEIITPSGPEQVLHKVITERKVERTKHGEVVAKNIRTIEKESATGETVQVEEEFQMLNPEYPLSKGSVKEIVSIVSERDITASYVTSRKNIIKETNKLALDLGMNKDKVELLVKEETEDVSNILNKIAPELVNKASELFSLRKRLQQLKLSPKGAGILEESVALSADLPTVEASPELIASIMVASEQAGITTIPPEQIFNSLFTKVDAGPVAVLSSASPGPLENVVIPISFEEGVHEEMLSREMEQVSTLVHFTDNMPSQDGYVKKLPVRPRKRGRRRRPYNSLSDEDPPWSEEALLISMEAVGAHPSFSMHASNISHCKTRGNLSKETAKGVEYMVDCQPLQHFSRVQLRGSQPPSWFPGYMVALSNMPDSVELAKSPSEVLFSAWKSVQPDVFADDSVVYN